MQVKINRSEKQKITEFYFCIINFISFLFFSFLLFLPLLWRETYLFGRQVKIKLEKFTLGPNNIKGWIVDSGGK